MDKRDEVKKTIYEVASDILSIDPEEISEDMELDVDLKIDSLALYEIVVELEEKFSIRISNEEADSFSTVGNAIDYVTSLL